MKKKVFRRVYEEVKKIPAGRVATYGEIAKKLKTSPRVVGFALHKNPTPITVPCHRIVGKNGYLTGYVYGIEEKRTLLKNEGVAFINRWQVKL